MFKTNPNDDQMWLKIKELVNSGSYKNLPTEENAVFEHRFYVAYETLMFQLEMECVPLRHSKGKFDLLPEFLIVADPVDLAEWRRVFNHRYNSITLDEEDSLQRIETVSEEEEWGDYPEEDNLINEFRGNRNVWDTDGSSEPPEMVYRESNLEYARMACRNFIRIQEYSEPADQYGWIENRKRELILQLGSLCDHYMLPRLAVSFMSDLHFVADESEIENFHLLFEKRKTSWDNAELEAVKHRNELDSDNDRKFSGKKHKAISQIIIEIYNNHLMDNQEKLRKEWELENKENNFPSKMSSYPEEVVAGFIVSGDIILQKDNKGILDLKDYNYSNINMNSCNLN